MPVFLAAMNHRLHKLNGKWYSPLVLLLFALLTSWPLMALAEPSLAARKDYYYWFVTTASTTGYGDLSPKQTGGRLVFLYVITAGIIAVTLFTARVVDVTVTASDRRRKGLLKLRHLHGHVTIIGWNSLVPRLVAELTANDSRQIVLYESPDRLGENPLPEKIEFRQGYRKDTERLAEVCANAESIILNLNDDDASLALATLIQQICSDVRLIVGLSDFGNSRLFTQPDVTCVPGDNPHLLASEAQCRGLSKVLTALMSSEDAADMYPLFVTDQLQGTQFRALVLALLDAPGSPLPLAVIRRNDHIVKPPPNFRLQPGDVVVCLSEQPVEAAQVLLARLQPTLPAQPEAPSH